MLKYVPVRLIHAAVIAVSAFFWGSNGFACDPNENCNDKCLVTRPWDGGCVVRGNDPICEARKAACSTINLGSIFSGPISIDGGVSIETINKCTSRPQDCLNEIVARGAYQFVKPIVDRYILHLRSQVRGGYQNIPPYIINYLSSFYPEINLGTVALAFNIDTIHGMDITIGNEIYFTRQMHFDQCADFSHLAHELEHVVQYARRGGIEPFMSEYILKSGVAVVQSGTVSAHDYVEIEQSATNKANSIPCPNGSYSGNSQPKICLTPFGYCLVPNFLAPAAPCTCIAPNGRPDAGMVQ